MGVVTTSDEKKEEAKQLIQTAYECLMEAADTDNQWAEPYREDYIDTLYDVATELRKLKRKL